MKFDDFVLTERPGYKRITFLSSCDTRTVYDLFKDAREQNNQNAFQIPFHINKAGFIVKHFTQVIEPENFIIDIRSDTEKEMIKKNQSTTTFKPNVEVYENKAQIITQQVSKLVWYPNIYQLEKERSILFLTGGTGSTT